jgi:HlyD family secretion protein
VKSQVSGVVESIYVQPGAMVKEGTQLARIKLLADPKEVNRAEADLKKAELRIRNTRDNLARQQDLFEQKIISQSELDDARLSFEIAEADLETARNNLDLILAGMTEKIDNTSTIVVATADGMILDRPVEQGDFVIESNTFNEGTTIFTLADMNEMIFKGVVEEADTGRLREGMKMQVNVGALPGESFEAKLEFISPKALDDEGRVRFEIEARLELKPDLFIRSGYSATAEVVMDEKQNVLAVEEGWLEFRDDGAVAWIVPDGGVESQDQLIERKVETGISDGIFVEIISGLKESDQIRVPDLGIDENS